MLLGLSPAQCRWGLSAAGVPSHLSLRSWLSLCGSSTRTLQFNDSSSGPGVCQGPARPCQSRLRFEEPWKARPAPPVSPRVARRHGPAGKGSSPRSNEVWSESGHSAPHFALRVLLNAWHGPARSGGKRRYPAHPSDSLAEPRHARAWCTRRVPGERRKSALGRGG